MAGQAGQDLSQNVADIAAWRINPPVSLTDPEFGAVLGEDNTAAFDAAYAKARATTRALTIPSSGAGEWFYDGDGFPNSWVPVIGEGGTRSKVRLGAGKYLFDIPSGMQYTHVEGLTVLGGAGVLRHTYTGVNTLSIHAVKGCTFHDYTGACFTSDSVDMPYWRFTDCEFKGADYANTMGLALPGAGSDHTHVKGCVFLRNRVHVKIRGGINAKIRDNDFIRWDTTRPEGPAVSLWIVPPTNGSDTGTGFESSGNKYGNENLAPGDFHIVVTDELPGAHNGEAFPNLTTPSVGRMNSLTSHHDTVSGSSNARTPFVFTTTPNLSGAVNVQDLNIVGSMPTEITRYLDPTLVAPSNTATQIVGPHHGTNAGTLVPAPVTSNAPDTAYTVDPAARMLQGGTVPPYHAGDPAGYRDLTTATRHVSLWACGDPVTPITDAVGGDDAVEITFRRKGWNSSTRLQPFTPGELVWVEVDVKPGAGNEHGSVMIQVEDRAGSAATAHHLARGVNFDGVTSWTRVRIPFRARAGGPETRLVVAATGPGPVCIGRAKVYHAREPQQSAVILTSPGGNRFLLTVGDDGSLSTTPAP